MGNSGPGESNPHGTMVGTKDFRENESFSQGRSKIIRDNEIIDPPANVPLTGSGSIRPPGIGGGSLRVKVAEGVDESGPEKFAHSFAFLVGETRVPAIGFGIGQINFLVGHVEVAAKSNGFLPSELAKIPAEIRIPGIVAVPQAGEVPLGIGNVNVHDVETIELASDHTPFANVRTVGKVHAHGKWFLLGEHRRAGVTFLVRKMITPKRITEIILGNHLRIQFHFLQAEDVGRTLPDEFVKTLGTTSPEAVHVPGQELDGGSDRCHENKLG